MKLMTPMIVRLGLSDQLTAEFKDSSGTCLSPVSAPLILRASLKFQTLATRLPVVPGPAILSASRFWYLDDTHRPL